MARLLGRGSTYGLLHHDNGSCLYKIAEGKIAVDSYSRLYPVTFILEKPSEDAFKCSLMDYFCPTHFFSIFFFYM